VAGCTNTVNFTVTENIDIECGTIQGKITIDDNDNCAFDMGEIPFLDYLVQAVGDQTFFDFIDANGEYVINALEGDYEVSVIAYDPILWLPCVASENVTVIVNDIATADFSIEKLIDCPVMEVQIATLLIRRYFDGYYVVNYCNNGTIDARIVITFTDQTRLTLKGVEYTAEYQKNGICWLEVLPEEAIIDLFGVPHKRGVSHRNGDVTLNYYIRTENCMSLESLYNPDEKCGTLMFLFSKKGKPIGGIFYALNAGKRKD
jgi:hypothetical protein